MRFKMIYIAGQKGGSTTPGTKLNFEGPPEFPPHFTYDCV